MTVLGIMEGLTRGIIEALGLCFGVGNNSFG
jgi:hypothetical protein